MVETGVDPVDLAPPCVAVFVLGVVSGTANNGQVTPAWVAVIVSVFDRAVLAPALRADPLAGDAKAGASIAHATVVVDRFNRRRAPGGADNEVASRRCSLHAHGGLGDADRPSPPDVAERRPVLIAARTSDCDADRAGSELEPVVACRSPVDERCGGSSVHDAPLVSPVGVEQVELSSNGDGAIIDGREVEVDRNALPGILGEVVAGCCIGTVFVSDVNGCGCDRSKRVLVEA